MFLITLSFLIPTLLCIIFFIKFTRNDKNKKIKLPPKRRSWPILGDNINLYKSVSSSYPSKFVHQQLQKFGKIFCCNLFGKWVVLSSDPNFNKFVMQNDGKVFGSKYPKSFRDLVGKNGVITVQGGQQRKLHGIASNLMKLDKLKSQFLNDIQWVLVQTLDKFQNNQIICLQDVCRKVAINLMVNQLLGVSSESEINEMAKLFSDFVDGCLSVPVNLPGFTYYTAMKARKRIICKIKKMIENHRRNGSEGGNNGVVGRLLDEENLEDDNAIADFILNLLFAGNETTSKTMLLAVYFLTRSPKAFQQLRDEQDNLKKSNELLTWQDYKAMPFTQFVINETLRIGGIAIWLMREATEDLIYQDYIIPKGCLVIPFLSAVHLDENLYKEALNFDPWRWMDPEYQEKKKLEE
uniref:Cytochrome p450 n=1 Tax=Croton stellatopilosus TaxID=431156 RepID=A0A3G2CJW8_9ROSI|nr:cytochrome p450 [Croton stellatopilosus]